MAAALFDADGCLSPRGFAQISAAPPGRAPAELAAHLAGCARCQRRLLVAALPSASPSPRRAPPPLWRTGVALLRGRSRCDPADREVEAAGAWQQRIRLLGQRGPRESQRLLSIELARQAVDGVGQRLQGGLDVVGRRLL